MKTIINIIWTTICLFFGSRILIMMLEQYPKWGSTLMPLYFVLWLGAIYIGHWAIAKVIE